MAPLTIDTPKVPQVEVRMAQPPHVLAPSTEEILAAKHRAEFRNARREAFQELREHFGDEAGDVPPGYQG